MTTYSTLQFSSAEQRAIITLNRPDKLNAYTVQMGEELVDAFRRARDHAAVRAIILTGAGRAFCAGVDLAALREPAAAGAVRLGEEFFVQGFAAELAAFPKPVIVAFNGAAIGVGVTMSLPCDIRIAAMSAKFGVPFAKLGIVPGLGSTHLLPQLVGLSNAKALIFGADTIDADEALRIGLVNEVVPDAHLLQVANQWVDKIIACDANTLSAAKAALNFGVGATMADAMSNEHTQNAALRVARGKQ